MTFIASFTKSSTQNPTGHDPKTNNITKRVERLQTNSGKLADWPS